MNAAFTRPQGDRTRAQLSDLLLQAGAEGTQLACLRQATGLRDTTVLFHLKRMPQAVHAKTALKYRVRWFHRQFEEAARAYVHKQDGIARHTFGCGAARVAAGMAAIAAAGRAGLTHAELAAATGIPELGANSITRRLRDEGRVVPRRTVALNGYTVLRFYVPDLAPAQGNQRPSRAQRRHNAKASMPTSTTAARSAEHHAAAAKAATHHQLTPPATSITAADHGLQLHPQARITVDPRGTVHRWDTDRPQFPAPAVAHPHFSALRPGQYPDLGGRHA